MRYPSQASRQGMAPEALPEARADATQASDAAGRPAPRRRAGQRRRPGQASDAAPGRPPARGGPTIDDAFVPLVERSYIVGPPPVSVHGRSCERETGHPQGVALLYTTCPHALVYSRATPCGWPAAAGSVRFWGHLLRVAWKRSPPRIFVDAPCKKKDNVWQKRLMAIDGAW